MSILFQFVQSLYENSVKRSKFYPKNDFGLSFTKASGVYALKSAFIYFGGGGGAKNAAWMGEIAYLYQVRSGG